VHVVALQNRVVHSAGSIRSVTAWIDQSEVVCRAFSEHKRNGTWLYGFHAVKFVIAENEERRQQ
jgi:hypothetical protein